MSSVKCRMNWNMQWRDFEWLSKCERRYYADTQKHFHLGYTQTPSHQHRHFIRRKCAFDTIPVRINGANRRETERARETEKKGIKLSHETVLKCNQWAIERGYLNQRPAQQLTIWYRFCMQLYVPLCSCLCLRFSRSHTVHVYVWVWVRIMWTLLAHVLQFDRISVVRCTHSLDNAFVPLGSIGLCQGNNMQLLTIP